MGRTILAALIAISILVPSVSDAQTGSARSGARPGMRGTPPPSPNQPLPPSPLAGPLNPPPPPSALDLPDIFRAGPRTYAPRFDRVPRRNPLIGYGTAGYITDPFGYISQPESSSPALDRYMQQGQSAGYLRLDVEPQTAQVYVDGYYAGTVADFNRGGFALDAGPHRIEMRADGFDSQSVELRIRANDVLSYRGTLTRRDQRPEQRAAAGTPKTFYVIPRCYAGTSRPRAEQLPAGCRLNDLRTVPPVVTPAQ
jgi:hypothetical protein